MNYRFIALALLIAATGPSKAQEISEGHKLAELTFESTDLNNRGYIDMGTMEEMRGLVFVSMDSNADEKLEVQEFLDWDYGFIQIAEESGRQMARETALRVVHSYWDLNADGEVTTTEHRKATVADFRRADLNDDAILTKDEFVGAYSVLVALRAALNPR